MPRRVPNPHVAGRSTLEPIGAPYSNITPGTYTISVPPNARWVRAVLRGAGGGGGSDRDTGGGGGGQGGVARGILPVRGSTITFTVGEGGGAVYAKRGKDGGDTILGKLIAKGGQGGNQRYYEIPNAAGGAGANGTEADNPYGYGQFSGRAASGAQGAGTTATALGASGTAGTGNGGNGADTNNATVNPGSGGSGRIILEFFK